MRWRMGECWANVAERRNQSIEQAEQIRKLFSSLSQRQRRKLRNSVEGLVTLQRLVSKENQDLVAKRPA
jgi:hypothetical protein